MTGTPTFELRPGDELRIVRVGVEYPPDATPDAPLPGPDAPAIIEGLWGPAMRRTDATTRGFKQLAWPPPMPDGQTWLVYQDTAGRTQRAQVHRDRIDPPEVYSPNGIDWDALVVVEGDVKAWPES